MTDPFKIDSPTCISFSGGRTSAYMLWRVLQSNQGLPAEAVVCFANTGKEDEATLRFVQDCSEHWNVPITWLEHVNAESPKDRWRQVTFETASRNGEPFEAIMTFRNYLPAMMARFCTVDLKIKVFVAYLNSLGIDEFDNFIGIRADEPRRVAKIRANPSDGVRGVTRHMPLASAGISSQDVHKFWKEQPFDLQLPVINGKTMHGNCDLCFLKPTHQLVSLIKERPQRAEWWVKWEKWGSTVKRKDGTGGNGVSFRPNDAGYEQMLKFSEKQIDMFDQDAEAIACFCGD